MSTPTQLAGSIIDALGVFLTLVGSLVIGVIWGPVPALAFVGGVVALLIVLRIIGYLTR